MVTRPQHGLDERRGLHRVVVRDLGMRIVRGQLGEGAALPPEADLSTELGVSRTVVREAIRVLAAKGLVESRPRTGTRALGRGRWRLVDPEVLAWQMEAGPDPGFFADLVEVRDIVEPRAAEAAAERATPEERAALLQLQDEMEAAAGDPATAIRIDLALHAGIVRASHNGLLAQLTGAVIEALETGPMTALPDARDPKTANRAHRGVVEAIGHADAAGARQAMEALIASTPHDSGRTGVGRSPARRHP
jgi:DNA-binding FadR family transcriptional regulator